MYKKFVKRFLPLGFAVILIGSYVGVCMSRPLPDIQPTQLLQSSKTAQIVSTEPDVTWSQYGAQAIGAVGFGVLASNGDNNPRPTASVAKVMAALAVLQKKPLNVGEQGPTLTLSAADVALYQQDNTDNQSVIPVQVGEQMTEYKALEAMLIPSATNIAKTLTNWAFGSQAAYLAYANDYAKTIGMTGSHFADASGYSPATVATPSDLIALGTTAIQNPVIAQIVNQKSVNLPVIGQTANFNIDVGVNGINGIKTGNTDEAGGVLLYSADYHGIKIVGVTMGALDLGTALHDAPDILESFKHFIRSDTVVEADQRIATYALPWGGSVTAVAKDKLTVVDIANTKIPLKVQTTAVSKAHYDPQSVGSVSFTYQGTQYTTPVVLTKPLPKPGIVWRLLHP